MVITPLLRPSHQDPERRKKSNHTVGLQVPDSGFICPLTTDFLDSKNIQTLSNRTQR